VIDERDFHESKHPEPRTSTLRGITIDRSDEFENAADFLRVNFESHSND
jgi:hypothetical protein